ncbi:undecaprenyl-phosphate glucose phosphotransferase [Luteimonas sp. BDR2-5]|uniref:undecaprenyl-phosphate glucose phosphotransferase n=1 Tax=Proluteimonas luteida TaxID=2878685 RepID=UPI002104475F|nr:undecaprenyl-phosphate glucose phosphotransferase [Luteimonas sp. BDR2-5]MCD9029531.1 undecaprenyl-phosphate glucose phosphotransferase [Luteimonas sp. BDR2-5]
MFLAPSRPDADADWRIASKFSAFYASILRASDLVLLAGMGVLAYWLRFGSLDLPLDYLRNIVRASLFALLVLNGSTLYRSWRGRGLVRESTKLLALWALVFTVAILYTVALSAGDHFSRVWWGSWFALTVAGTIATRVVVRRFSDHLRARGIDQRSAVIVGGGREAKLLATRFAEQPWIGIEVKGWFAPPHSRQRMQDIPLLGTADTLADYVDKHHIDQIWIALPMSAGDEIQELLRRLRHSTADIKFVPDLFGMQLLNHSVEQVAGVPIINLRSSPLQDAASVLKAVEDKVLGGLILLLIAPVMLAVAIGVKLSSPGPVFFKQRRHGLNGRVIDVLKFRSMRVHAEETGTVTQATKGDPRVTRFGSFLRRTSLDELPQFLNVIKGDMSIVGPRPHAIAHNHQYMEQVADYMQRHRVKPGITGWAQVNGLRGETDTLDKMARRVEHDLYYLQNWSLAFDLKIIVMTVFKGFVGRNAY